MNYKGNIVKRKNSKLIIGKKKNNNLSRKINNSNKKKLLLSQYIIHIYNLNLKHEKLFDIFPDYHYHVSKW